MRLLLDACVPIEWKDYLAREDIDCSAWLDIVKPNAPDAEIFDYPRREGRIVVTHDLDFGRLLAFSRATFPSIVQIRAADIRPAAMGQLLVGALKLHATVLEQGALATIEPDRTRIRILPIES